MADQHVNPMAPPPPEPAEKPIVAFCQQCGLGLTADSVRVSGSRVFCQPCAQIAAVPPTNGADYRGSAATPTGGTYTPVPGPTQRNSSAVPPAAGEPNPVLAGFLGLIPGVGAMYNGQYAKGVVHLVVFVVLTSLADNLNWVLWWFVWGWIFYQAFEAFHTAQARQEGAPLPDPFGWNDLGDRLGFARTSSTSLPRNPSPKTASAPQAPPEDLPRTPSRTASTEAASTEFYAPSPASHNSPAAAYGSGGASGQVPLETPWRSTSEATAKAFSGQWSPIAPETTPPQSVQGSFGQTEAKDEAYTPTYTGEASTSASNATGLSARFPAGAAWLIGLGGLFLVANLAPDWHLQARWLVPLLLAAVAAWMGAHRIVSALRHPGTPAFGQRVSLAEGLLGPVLLFTVAVLLSLQSAHLVPLRHSWPAILIVWGTVLLLRRTRLDSPDALATPAMGDSRGNQPSSTSGSGQPRHPSSE